MKDTTIAAISTAQGEGGIGMIRISGSDAIAVADRVFVAFSKEKKLAQLEGYRAVYGKIIENSEMLDEAVAIVYRSPHSYTGEDVVELCCHGGLYVTRQVLRTVLANGAVLAEPGEFTKRAFLNGKMDLCEAQSVMNIISASSRGAARAAISVKSGAVSRRMGRIKDELVHLASHLSAWADYPEEDIPEVNSDSVLSILENARDELSSLICDYDVGRAIISGVDTVIVGRPNVGKSTLMNLLSGFDKSIVTEIPGTTRDVVEETVVIGDITLRLSDTAGLRDTENVVERIGVDRTLEKLSSCSLVLAVFDGSDELTSEDKELIGKLGEVPTLAVINKSDLATSIDIQYIKSKIGNVVQLSAKNGDGKKELENAICRVCGVLDFDASQGVLSTEREREAVQNALNSVLDAIDTLTMGFSLDAVTVCVEDAIGMILTLTGENVSETVVDEVFHRFCLGK